MSGTVGTGKRCPPWRASGECVRVCVRVRLSFSSTRKSLGLLVCGLVICTLGLRVSWWSLFGWAWVGWARSPRGQLRGVGSAPSSRPHARLQAPGTCQRMLVPRPVWPRVWAGTRARSSPPGLGTTRGPSTAAGPRGDPDPEPSKRLLWPEWGEDSDSNCDSAGLPGLLCHRLFTLLPLRHAK